VNNVQHAHEANSDATTWDNGYPDGGNYWSDYTGTDANDDGIGDTPYNISGGSNQDRYPVINQDGWKAPVNNPPNTPANPSPADDATDVTVDTNLGWTGGDPDGDPVTYTVYFGTTSNPPLVSTVSGPSYNPGSLEYLTTYYWKIIAVDTHDATTAGPVWEFTTEEAPVSEPQLSISAPPSVNEETSFQVMVTADGTPVAEVRVTFADVMYLTDTDGIVDLIAPSVDQNTTYRITADKTGYLSDSTWITVLNQEEELHIGWVHGIVMETIDNTTTILQDAMVCLTLSIQNKEITSKCTFTDETGGYTITAPTGMYALKAGKEGYITSTITEVTIQGNETTWTNFTLEQGTGSEPGIIPIFIEEYREEINQAIETGDVGAEVVVQPETEESMVFSYNDVTVDPFEITDESISLLVNGDETGAGKTIVVTIEGFALDQEVVVAYDGIPLTLADGIQDVLDPNNDGSIAEYIAVQDPDGTRAIMVSVPHFSEHEITIYTLGEVVEAINFVTALVVYFAIIVVTAIFATVHMKFVWKR
jgi:hypothetical protein